MYVYACVYVSVYLCVHTYMYVYACVYVSVYLCVCILTCIRMWCGVLQPKNMQKFYWFVWCMHTNLVANVCIMCHTSAHNKLV